MNKKIKYILIILIFIGIILGINRTIIKNDFEKNNRIVDLVMSLEEVNVLSDRSGIPLVETLKKLINDANITSCSFRKYTC